MKRRYAALENWTEAIEGVFSAVSQKASSGSRMGEGSLMNFPPESFGAMSAYG